jgi:hypothetical protein
MSTVTAAQLLKQKVSNCINFVEEIIIKDSERIVKEKGMRNLTDEQLNALLHAPESFKRAMTPFLALNENLLFAMLQGMFLDNMDLTEKLMDHSLTAEELVSDLMSNTPLAAIAGAEAGTPMPNSEELNKLRQYGMCFFGLTCKTIEEARVLARQRREMMAAISIPTIASDSFSNSPGTDQDNGPEGSGDSGRGGSEGEHHPGRAGDDGAAEEDGQEEGSGRGEAESEGPAQVQDGQ